MKEDSQGNSNTAEDEQAVVSMKEKIFTAEDCAIMSELGGIVPSRAYLQAHVSRVGGEHRIPQEKMIEKVEDSLSRRIPVMIQAGTGTGKSFAYIFAIATQPGRYVIATSTNQLGEQLVKNDLPAAKKTLKEAGKNFTFSLLKGRSNYICLAKVQEVERLEKRIQPHKEQESLFGNDEDEISEPLFVGEAQETVDLFNWLEKTTTGDRTDAPPTVTGKTWAKFSSTPSECIGAECPFFDDCYSEKARGKARNVDVVVTNHAFLAQEMRLQSKQLNNGSAVMSFFGNTNGIIIDEAHDFVDALSSALTETVDLDVLEIISKKVLRFANKKIPGLYDGIEEKIDLVKYLFNSLPTGERFTRLSPELEEELWALHDMLTDFNKKVLGKLVQKVDASEGLSVAEAKKMMISRQLEEQVASIRNVLNATTDEVVWLEQRGIGKDFKSSVLKMSPLDVGHIIKENFDDRTLVATSATLTLNKSFIPTLNAYGLDNVAETLDVGSPFEYPKQGMLYIPTVPFPEPVGKERVEHTAAVLTEIEDLVQAAGGRTLALFTTGKDAEMAAEHLRKKIPYINILKYGEKPATILVSEFVSDETSVLCATMGMWQGVDALGATCSLVIINKVAFTPPSDVLSNARAQNINANGGNGFRDIILAQAASSLAQASGRLIRSKTDKGVVAILDPRLHTKNYGKDLLGSLPNFNLFTDKETVMLALNRLTGGMQENVTKSKPKKYVPHAKKSATRQPQKKVINKKNISRKPISAAAMRKRRQGK